MTCFNQAKLGYCTSDLICETCRPGANPKPHNRLVIPKSKCSQCGKESNDLMTAFTADRICGRCTKANHKQATKK